MTCGTLAALVAGVANWLFADALVGSARKAIVTVRSRAEVPLTIPVSEVFIPQPRPELASGKGEFLTTDGHGLGL